MKGKEKRERSRRVEDSGRENRLYSKGVAMLVFIMLAVQFVFFAGYIIKNFFGGSDEALSVEEVIPQKEERASSPVAGVSKSDGQAKSGRHSDPERKSDFAKKSGNSIYSGGRSGPDAGNAPKREEDGPKWEKDRPKREESSPKQKLEYDGWKWDMVELNSADSAALVGLPGIGPYYAKKILLYREKLWNCYADKRQLLEIRGIDSVLFRKIENRIYVEPASVKSVDLYAVSLDSLSRHPYIGHYAARGIVKFREMTAREEFTLQALVENRIISETQAKRLGLYVK